jgi:outer membrane protein assembly factor BamB
MNACLLRITFLFLIVLATGLQTTVQCVDDGADWPHWLGPNRDGTSPERGLLRAWPAEGPKVLWRTKIAQGWSVPSVMGDEVYVSFTDFSKHHPEHKTTEGIVCLDAATGAERWNHTYLTLPYYSRGVNWPEGGVRSTPAVTDKAVYFMGAIGHLVCLDRRSHQVAWESDLDQVWFPGPYPEWKGACFSPVVENGKLILPLLLRAGYFRPARADTACVALDALTGKMLWNAGMTDKPEPGKVLPAFATPQIATIGNEKCVVRHEMNRLTIFKLSDGKVLMDYEHPEDLPNDNRQMTMGTPIATNGGFFVVPGAGYLRQLGFNASSQMKVDWTTNDSANPIMGFALCHTFVPCNGCLFGFSGSTDPNNLPNSAMTLYCIDAKSGKVLWTEKGFKLGTSLIAGDGLLFIRSAQSLLLVDASPKGYALKGKIEKLHDVASIGGKDGGWVMPVLSRGKLYLRTPSELICFKVK